MAQCAKYLNDGLSSDPQPHIKARGGKVHLSLRAGVGDGVSAGVNWQASLARTVSLRLSEIP